MALLTFEQALERLAAADSIAARVDKCIASGLNDADSMARLFFTKDEADGAHVEHLSSVLVHRAAILRNEGTITSERFGKMLRHLATHSDYNSRFREGERPTSREGEYSWKPLPAPTTTAAPTKETVAMQFTTKHFIDGVDVDTLSTEQRIAKLAALEQKIAEYKAVKVKSKLVADEIARLQVCLNKMVALFDNE